jgi:hypothetical protein
MVAHAHPLPEQMLVAIAHEMLELADVLGHRLRGRARISLTTGIEDPLVRRDDGAGGCPSYSAHAVMLSVREEADRAQKVSSSLPRAGARDDAVELAFSVNAV